MLGVRSRQCVAYLLLGLLSACPSLHVLLLVLWDTMSRWHCSPFSTLVMAFLTPAAYWVEGAAAYLQHRGKSC